MSDVTYPGDNDRERLTDDSRDGSKRLTKADVGFDQDFSVTTIEEETMAGGWNRIQKPVGGTPKPVTTGGERGEPGDWDEASRSGSAADRY